MRGARLRPGGSSTTNNDPTAAWAIGRRKSLRNRHGKRAMEKTAMKPPWKTPRHSPPVFPTFPQLRLRLRVLKLRNFVVLSHERKQGAGQNVGAVPFKYFHSLTCVTFPVCVLSYE